MARLVVRIDDEGYIEKLGFIVDGIVILLFLILPYNQYNYTAF